MTRLPHGWDRRGPDTTGPDATEPAGRGWGAAGSVGGRDGRAVEQGEGFEPLRCPGDRGILDRQFRVPPDDVAVPDELEAVPDEPEAVPDEPAVPDGPGGQPPIPSGPWLPPGPQGPPGLSDPPCRAVGLPIPTLVAVTVL